MAYQGKLSSFLTTPVYENRIASYKDINESGLTVSIQSLFARFLQNTNFKKFEISKNSVPEDLTRVAINRNITMIINYYAIVELKNVTLDPKTIRYLVYTVPELNLLSYLSNFLVQKGHPLWKNFSERLYYVHASGLPSKWLKDYLAVESKQIIYQETMKPLSMDSVEVPALILFLGVLLSFIIFCFEKCCSR